MLKEVFLAGAAMAASFSIAAADYPSRNIENIFPWGPGTAYASSQIITDALAEELGVKISVVSTPGGAGAKAIQKALKKPADGHTIIDGWVANLVLQPNLGNVDWKYDDFTPLWSATQVPFALVSRKNETRWYDFESFIAYAKANPGKLRYSSGTYKNLPHMIIAQVLRSQGVYARNVPYPQDGDAFKDLRSGLLDFTFNNPTTYKNNKDAFKPLVVLNEDKGVSTMFDNAPTVKDLGVDMGLTGLSASGWNWYLVHKETPQEVVDEMRAAMKRALDKAETQEKLISLGFYPSMFSPEQYEDIVSAVSSQLTNAQTAIQWEKDKLAGK
ncbi:tripartite tricarboxylate transporter substrate binding protein [Vibrio sp. ZSDZ34]|uniref:Tripartite tricarboxylate transporter substrate binding protein n=1 Tax=Vibrio gelatinilyticus TaxID=2893468 RepID=A0A9X1WEB2_9VIBR|nr:tripartite tricarboxylate transporter substrate binding protein [Vibrio gelatinilyticus]MCJ2377633.1 tripartite tricarboxylate transporter substrate binding protein [Vibrio gelatinilyticus]